MDFFTSHDDGLRELALFSGAGGGILGGKLLGWRTVCAIERDAYCAAVLAQRQSDGLLTPFPIWSDVTTFDGRPWQGIVDIVSGGFPCQDISVAGKGAGLDGERSGLWKQFARIIGEVRPRYAFIENSPALVYRGLDRVLCDLAALGFDAEWGVLSAADVGAHHLRKRIWILANATRQPERKQADETDPLSVGWKARNESGNSSHADADADSARQLQPQGNEQEQWRWPGHVCPHVPDCDCVQGLEQEPQPSAEQRQAGLQDRARSQRVWPNWPAEPDVGRVADRVANRMDRIKAIGNGQVSRVAAEAFLQLLARYKGR